MAFLEFTGGIIPTGKFDISQVTSGASIAGLDGSGGTISLGAKTLTITGGVGEFDGAIKDGGLGGGTGGNLILGAGASLVLGNNNNNYTGTTTVDGTLDVLGSIATSSQTTVASGGTLTGSGTVGNTQVDSGGTFQPGTTSTKMTITGSLVLQTAATYLVALSGVNTSGASVVGSATITGATFVVTNGSLPVANTNYLVLQTTSPVTGQFANSEVVFAGNLRGRFDYTSNPDDVFLDVTFGTISPLLPPGAPTNVVNVASAMDTYILAGGTLPASFQNIFNFTPQQIETVLGQLTGEAAKGSGTSTMQLVNDFFSLLSDMALGTGGGGAAGGGGGQFAATPDYFFPPELALAYDKLLGKAAPRQSFEQRWTAWGSGFGGAATLNGNAAIGSSNVNASDFGFAGGMDYHAAPDLKLGFALGGAGTNWSLSQNLGGGRSDVLQIAGYGIKHYGPLYFTSMAAFSNSWFTTQRTAAFGDQLRATFDGQSYALRGEAGYRFAVLPTAGITPYAAAQTQWFHTPGYSETDLTGGGFGLTFNSQTANDTRSELGARADDLTSINNTPLVLRARLAWAHDWVSNAALGAVFQALPGTAFTVNGAAVPQNSALVSAGGQLFFTANWSVEAKFDGEFASSAQTYAGTGTLRYSW